VSLSTVLYVGMPMADPTSRSYESPMAAMHEVFRSSLASAPALIGSAKGDDARRALIANYYANIFAFLEDHHGAEEDHIFPLLIERAPQERSTVEHSKKQHHEVLSLLADAESAVTKWEADGDDDSGEAISALRALDEALTPHLDDEESTIVPLITEYVKVEDVPMFSFDGFKGDKPWLILGLVSENLSEKQREVVSNRTPPEMQEWWDTVGEPSFNEMIAKVRQTS